MTITSDKTLFQSVVKMIDSLSSSGNYDTIIHILSLLCLFSVLNQTPAQNTAQAPAASGTGTAGSPLQKLLGDLMQGGNGGSANPLGSALGAALGSPDLLSSLLPLLNNPQVKSKINPTNIASVMGMINNLGGLGGLANLAGSGSAAPEKSEPKPPPEKKTTETETILPAANNETEPLPNPPPAPAPAEEAPKAPSAERKAASRFLNWKTNF